MNQDPQTLFASAERNYLEKRFDRARNDLIAVEKLVTGQSAIPHLRAVVERRLGNLEDSRRAFERAAALAPGDHQIAHNFGNLLSDMGELEAALAQYRRAAQIAPGLVAAQLRIAMTLHQLGRRDEALGWFERACALDADNPSVWEARGSAELDAGRADDAEASFVRALALDPGHRRAAIGRARVARARGEADAAELYAGARRASPGDRALIIEEAEVRAAAGETDATADLLKAVEADPGWADGQDALARLRWELGDTEGFAGQIEKALATSPGNFELWARYVQMLGDSGQFARAADAAHSARQALGADRGFALSEAAFASLVGDQLRAGRLFAALPADAPHRALHEARHRIRTGEFDQADRLLGEGRDGPEAITAWALTDLVWRAAGDPRSSWLSGQHGLVSQQQIELGDEDLARLAGLLRALHLFRARPLGQSLRGGTQTRYRLFDRKEPELAQLRQALLDALRRHRAQLPPPDGTHPLLRHRDSPLDFLGSWSVRLTASGRHVSHIHPEGLISSACYISVPALDAGDREGWLEIGAPPPDLGLQLAPLQAFEPCAGRLVLFPSYLFHGTRPFASGERLTVAFDAGPTA